MSSKVEATREQIEALSARPADTPVVMVNLLKFKQDGGLESYLRYAREVAPHLERVGAQVRYAGAAPTVVIGEGATPEWDAILIVEYPSPAAFISMVTTEEYGRVHTHRAAALDQGELIATSVWSLG
jgi:uncharacterized protein (DUF1330 family)